MTTPDDADDGPLDAVWLCFGTGGLLPRGVIVFVAAVEQAGYPFTGDGRADPALGDAHRAYAKVMRPFIRRVLAATPPGVM